MWSTVKYMGLKQRSACLSKASLKAGWCIQESFLSLYWPMMQPSQLQSNFFPSVCPGTFSFPDQGGSGVPFFLNCHQQRTIKVPIEVQRETDLHKHMMTISWAAQEKEWKGRTELWLFVWKQTWQASVVENVTGKRELWTEACRSEFVSLTCRKRKCPESRKQMLNTRRKPFV